MQVQESSTEIPERQPPRRSLQSFKCVLMLQLLPAYLGVVLKLLRRHQSATCSSTQQACSYTCVVNAVSSRSGSGGTAGTWQLCKWKQPGEKIVRNTFSELSELPSTFAPSGFIRKIVPCTKIKYSHSVPSSLFHLHPPTVASFLFHLPLYVSCCP